MNYADLIIANAARAGDALAVQLGDRSLSYAEFVAESSAIAHGLTALGVGVGDHVMMFADNSIEHLVMYHAAARLGAVFVPLHAGFKERELRYAVSNTRPRVAIVGSNFLDPMRNALQAEGLESIVVLGPDAGARPAGSGLHAFADLLGRREDFEPRELPPEQPLLISFTSGTTSLPKPVLRSHQAETWSGQAYPVAWGIGSDDRLLMTMSLGWVYGLCTLSQSGLCAGAAVIVDKSFSPTRSLELIERQKITAFAGTMSMYALLLNILKDREFDTSSLRKLYLGGEPRNETLVAEAQRRFGLRLCEGWALTECFPAIAIHPIKDKDAPPASLGRLVEGSEIRLVDEQGHDVAPGQLGEAWLRSPGAFLGYNGEPELTAQRRTPDGWIRSGDILFQDADGYYTFVTRQNEMIIRGGANISPAEIEAAICGHGAVADAMVVGVPDPVMGQSVVALVTRKSPQTIDPDALRAFLQERIAKYKLPAHVFEVEALPAGTTGKKNRPEGARVAQSRIDALPPQVG